MNQDLTVGKPSRVLWKFCLPLFGSIIFQQLYNLADSLVAGKFIGENALAAVGNSYEITLIFLAFAFGCNIGVSVIVSQLFGAKEYGKMKTAVSTASIAGAVLCALLMLCGFLLTDPLLEMINTPPELLDDCRLYLDIYVAGLPFVFFYNIATGIFSALGDSRTPFWFLAASSTANIGADILFVTTFRMGVAGVAWATFICQGVSCVLAVLFVVKRLAGFRGTGKLQIFSASLLGRIAVIAIPSILQQSFVSVGNIMIQSVINNFRATVIAGYSAAIKLNNLALTSFTTIGNGISNYTAQNRGAGKYDRIRAGFPAAVRMILCIAVPFAALFLLGGRPLVSLFMEHPEGGAMDVALEFLRIVSPFYLVISVKMIADGILRGSGKMVRFMIATFTDLILRVVLATVLSEPFGTTGIWSAWPVGWCIATVVSLVFCLLAIRKKHDPKPLTPLEEAEKQEDVA